MKVIIAGRPIEDDFFKLSGIREWKKLSHTPVIVFHEKENEVEVEIIDRPEGLLSLPPETKCMMQWRGEWSSDFFQFDIYDLLTYIKENPKEDYQRI